MTNLVIPTLSYPRKPPEGEYNSNLNIRLAAYDAEMSGMNMALASPSYEVLLPDGLIEIVSDDYFTHDAGGNIGTDMTFHGAAVHIAFGITTSADGIGISLTMSGNIVHLERFNEQQAGEPSGSDQTLISDLGAYETPIGYVGEIDRELRYWSDSDLPKVSHGIVFYGDTSDLVDALEELDRVRDDALEEGYEEPTHTAIHNADLLVKTMYEISPQRFDVYPMSDGEVVIDGGYHGRRIGVFCYPDGRILYIGWENGERRRIARPSADDIPRQFLEAALQQLSDF